METAPKESRPVRWWQAGGLAIVAAALVNLLILAVGTIADASFVVVDNGKPADVNVPVVLTATVVPLAIGFLIAALVDRWRPRLVVPLAIVAAAFAVVSMAGPLAADTDTGTKTALAAMHLVAGAAFLGGVAAVRSVRPVLSRSSV